MAISGSVEGREAVISLPISDRQGQVHSIEAIVDTGFTGYLMLPSALIQRLELAPRDEKPVILADGSVANSQTYVGIVDWHGEARRVRVHEVDGRPLIGMSLLRGSRLTVDVMEGGAVAIEPLPDLA